MRRFVFLSFLLVFSLSTKAQFFFSSFIIDSTGQGSASEFAAIKYHLVFQANDGKHGSESWLSNGRKRGTHLQKDIWQGNAGSDASEFTLMDGKLYFSAEDSIHGRELWVTSGSRASTMLLKDISPGKFGSNPNEFVVVGGKLLFETQDTAHKAVMYSSDGTEAGTQVFKQMNANLDVSILHNNILYFDGSDGVHGSEPWVTDGTIGGTHILKDINTKKVLGISSDPRQFTLYNGKIYFSAEDSLYGNEVWMTDGTTGGTKLFKDINPGGIGSLPKEFEVANGKLFFVASDSLWVTDGTPANTKNLQRGGNVFSLPSHLRVYGNYVYFFAFDNAKGTTMWRSDGTTGGTVLFKDLNPTGNIYQQYGIHAYIEFKNKLYFTAEAAKDDNRLFVTDGTGANTTILEPDPDSIGVNGKNPLAFGYFRGFMLVNNGFFFGARFDSGNFKLWRYGAVPEDDDIGDDVDDGIKNTEIGDNRLKVYPNPVNDEMVIQSTDFKGAIQLTIFDLLGKEITSFNMTAPSTSISISHLPNGLYFLKTNNGQAKPFVVSH